MCLIFSSHFDTLAVFRYPVSLLVPKNEKVDVHSIQFFPDNNKSLAPTYDIGWKFFDVMVKNHIWQYNYTLNPDGIFNAIKYMYTYYPDPNNRSHIREEFINVSTYNIPIILELPILKT